MNRKKSKSFCPGPWRYRPEMHEIISYGRPVVTIANISFNRDDYSIWANARLISVAPEMFELIQEMYPYVMESIYNERFRKRKERTEKILDWVQDLVNRVNNPMKGEPLDD